MNFKTEVGISLLVVLLNFICLTIGTPSVINSCKGSGKTLKYLSGDALTDNKDCLGPDGTKYPSEAIGRLLPRIQSRTGRSFNPSSSVVDPFMTQRHLIDAYKLSRDGSDYFNHRRRKRQADNSTSINESDEEEVEENEEVPEIASKKNSCLESNKTPARLCQSTFNTTAPMYGVSLTSGKPVTIVQKFPDLLQQVVYETCDSKECDLIHGECIQTYIPYLFLVIPLGPVTLTGQDYVLVESGCTCRPKYAAPGSDPNPTSVIPNFA